MRGLLLVAFGIALLYATSASFTGLFISETCCSGVSCQADSVCDEYEQTPAATGESQTLIFFVATTLVALSLIAWIERKEKN